MDFKPIRHRRRLAVSSQDDLDLDSRVGMPSMSSNDGFLNTRTDGAIVEHQSATRPNNRLKRRSRSVPFHHEEPFQQHPDGSNKHHDQGNTRLQRSSRKQCDMKPVGRYTDNYFDQGMYGKFGAGGFINPWLRQDVNPPSNSSRSHQSKMTVSMDPLQAWANHQPHIPANTDTWHHHLYANRHAQHGMHRPRHRRHAVGEFDPAMVAGDAQNKNAPYQNTRVPEEQHQHQHYQYAQQRHNQQYHSQAQGRKPQQSQQYRGKPNERSRYDHFQKSRSRASQDHQSKQAQTARSWRSSQVIYNSKKKESALKRPVLKQKEEYFIPRNLLSSDKSDSDVEEIDVNNNKQKLTDLSTESMQSSKSPDEQNKCNQTVPDTMTAIKVCDDKETKEMAFHTRATGMNAEMAIEMEEAKRLNLPLKEDGPSKLNPKATEFQPIIGSSCSKASLYHDEPEVRSAYENSFVDSKVDQSKGLSKPTSSVLDNLPSKLQHTAVENTQYQLMRIYNPGSAQDITNSAGAVVSQASPTAMYIASPVHMIDPQNQQFNFYTSANCLQPDYQNIPLHAQSRPQIHTTPGNIFPHKGVVPMQPSHAIPQHMPTYTHQNTPTYTHQNTPTYTHQNNSTYTNQNTPTHTNLNTPTYIHQNTPTYTHQNAPTYTQQNTPTYTYQNSYYPQNNELSTLNQLQYTMQNVHYASPYTSFNSTPTSTSSSSVVVNPLGGYNSSPFTYQQAGPSQQMVVSQGGTQELTMEQNLLNNANLSRHGHVLQIDDRHMCINQNAQTLNAPIQQTLNKVPCSSPPVLNLQSHITSTAQLPYSPTDSPYSIQVTLPSPGLSITNRNAQNPASLVERVGDAIREVQQSLTQTKTLMLEVEENVSQNDFLESLIMRLLNSPPNTSSISSLESLCLKSLYELFNAYTVDRRRDLGDVSDISIAKELIELLRPVLELDFTNDVVNNNLFNAQPDSDASSDEIIRVERINRLRRGFQTSWKGLALAMQNSCMLKPNGCINLVKSKMNEQLSSSTTAGMDESLPQCDQFPRNMYSTPNLTPETSWSLGFNLRADGDVLSDAMESVSHGSSGWEMGQLPESMSGSSVNTDVTGECDNRRASLRGVHVDILNRISYWESNARQEGNDRLLK